MSTATRRSHSEALSDAKAFRDLFDRASYSRWTIAGSVRRRCSDVGDVEHVVEPLMGPAAGAGLFAEYVNLVPHRLDELVAGGVVTKHIYGTAGFRWGQKYRGVDFRGFNHEVFIADADNWGGATLAIRTGPADFSRELVTGLLRRGLRNHLGYVWECRPCACGRDEKCKLCQGTGLEPVSRLSVGDERAYLSLCGAGWVEPEARG